MRAVWPGSDHCVAGPKRDKGDSDKEHSTASDRLALSLRAQQPQRRLPWMDTGQQALRLGMGRMVHLFPIYDP